MKKIVKMLILVAIAAVLMAYMFVGAVLQASYRNYPPTAAELADDPTLERYLP